MKKILLFACGLLGSFGGNVCFAEAPAKNPTVKVSAAGNTFMNPFAAAANRSLCAPKSNFRFAKSAVAMSGNYTINKNAAASATNFISFSAAAQELATSGVAGPVTITVVANSGPYNEQVILPAFSGVSATNTITFEGNGNTVSGTVTATNQGVFTFTGADFVKLNNLVIAGDPAASTSSAIYFGGISDNNSVTNSTINIPLTSTSFDANGIMVGPSLGNNANNANNLRLQNNIINGGYFGIAISGVTSTSGNRIMGNQLHDQRGYGIYINNGGTGTIIEGNDISRPNRVNSHGLQGISLLGTTTNTVVSKNRVHNTHDQASNKFQFVYAFYSSAATTPGNENIFKNNLVYNVNNSTGTLYAFYNLGSNNTYYYHNTVSADDPTVTFDKLRGFYVQNNSTNIKIINNIVSLTTTATTKHAIYLADNSHTLVSNNNDLYVGSTGNVGYFLSNYPTLANWKTANAGAWDQNSIAVDPAFINAATGDLMPTATTVYNIGQPLPSVTDDILGNPRSSTTPDPGAFEFTQPANDAGITAINAPTSPVSPGNQQVTVTLKNFGSAALTSATIGWKVNGVAQPDYTWTGSLTSLQATTTPFPIGNYNFPTGSANICAWTKNANGATDPNKANDSTCTTINICTPLSGNFTINKNNPASATNFLSISAAAQKLNSCGVSGPVTITVAPNSGPYTEQIELQNIPFTSATNTVTFEGSGNTVLATSGIRLGVFVLNGAKHVKINNFVITVPTTATQGWGVQLINAADYNTISNNTINLPVGNSVSFNGIVAGAAIEAKGNNTNYSKIQNNIINGGSCGIQLNGNLGSLDAVNNQITGNQVKDSYYYGIFVGNGNGTLIEGNEITRPSLTVTPSFSGIYLFGETTNSIISKNRIHNTHDMIAAGGASVYGIYHGGTNNNVGNNTFKNNLIYNLNTVGGDAVGIYSSGATGHFFYHNTITAAPGFTYTTLKGIVVNNTNNVKIFNNLISLPGPTAQRFCIYVNGSSSLFTSNYNNLNPGSSGGYVGYYQTDHATLAFWQGANSFDLNSVSVDPVFANPAAGNYQPTAAGTNDKGQAQPSVTDDILGVARNPVNPDPGAYEFGVVANDVGIIAVTGPNTTGCGLTTTETITVTLKNYGTSAKTSVPVSYAINGVAIAAPETFTGNLAPQGTATFTFNTKANLTTAGNHRIIARTVLAGDAIPANDPDTLDVVNYLLSGLPVNLNFETPATGIAKIRKVVNSRSGITESAGASNGTTSTKGLILDGIDFSNWVIPGATSNPWAMNPDNFAGAYFCFSPGSGLASDSLVLTFDLKQLYKAANANTNFRVTVNGTQVGPTYKPPFGGPSTNWQKVRVNLTPYLNNTTIQVGLESSVKETYDNGNGTANLIDNVEVRRFGITGVKADELASRLSVFPNPSTGNFYISLPTGKTYSLEVTDLAGKTILKREAKGETQLKLETAAKGIYLLKVSSENASVVRKLIVE